ncbi:hypothetical protein X949_5967 [Burkholderia pseudomallei MSHR5609]|nr:hypothetical protein X949_5967 [Burkholderia pseudomallei MSHR5609]
MQGTEFGVATSMRLSIVTPMADSVRWVSRWRARSRGTGADQRLVSAHRRFDQRSSAISSRFLPT